MNRRAFLSAMTSTLLAAPLVAARIGVLANGTAPTEAHRHEAFRQGLNETRLRRGLEYRDRVSLR